MTDRVQGTETIAAPPEQLYTLISDLPRMGEWSPENTGGTWLDGASAAAVGATFKGDNRHGSKSWSTKVTVTAVNPGKEFAFAVSFGPMSIAEWRYELVADGRVTTVTETCRDQRNAVLRRFGGIVAGVSDRAAYTQVSIDTTLAALKRAAEAQTAS